MATTVCISVGRCSSQLQCQKIKMDCSSGSMVVAGMKMAGRLSIHKGTSSMVSTKYRKMKISMNAMTGDLQMLQDMQEHPARHSSTLCQPKQEHPARHYSTSEEIMISQINKDTSQLSELVGALKADDAVTFSSVVKSIYKEHNKLTLDLEDIIQGIRIPGDTLIHTAARYKAERTLNLICKACPPLLTAQNLVGDTVWHVVATEGLDLLFRQLSAFRSEEQLSKAGKNGQHLRLDSLNNEGNTALHASLISRNESIAYALFEMTPDGECKCYFLPNKEGKSAIYLAAEAGYVKLLRRMMKFAAAHPGILSETPKGKSSIFHDAIAGKHSVPKKVAADQFASLSTANTSETTSVGISPQYRVPLPQSQLGSPLFWVGVGVGLSALSSWGAAKLKASSILIQDTTE